MTVHRSQDAAALQRQLALQEQREQQSAALWRMSPLERERAMWAGELSLRQLCEWSARRPQEVPKLGGEFAWIVMTTPEWAEAADVANASARRTER
ncbi:MAG TPA: hypothetical protein VF712_18785 [Thermoleophilaceae bacterium]|jgi:hypothetical protein